MLCLIFGLFCGGPQPRNGAAAAGLLDLIERGADASCLVLVVGALVETKDGAVLYLNNSVVAQRAAGHQNGVGGGNAVHRAVRVLSRRAAEQQRRDQRRGGRGGAGAARGPAFRARDIKRDCRCGSSGCG